ASLIIYSYPSLVCDNMRKGTIITALVAFLLLMPAIPGVMALPENLSVTTDRANYRPGEVVKVSGVATKSGIVYLEFKAGSETITPTVNPTADENGNYQYDYNLPAEPYIGTWTIEVMDSNERTATTSFKVFKTNTIGIADRLLDITQESEDFVSAQLASTSTSPQAAQENYEAGVKALDEAQILFDSTKYAASIEASLRAQRYFANALRILAIGHPLKTIDDETRLTNQIERAQKMLKSLQELFDNIKDKLTENSDAIQTALDAAGIDIGIADTARTQADYTQAQTSLKDATEHMKTARTLLQDYASDRKKEQIISFIDKAEERIDKLKAAVEKIRERIGDTEANEIIGKLDVVREKLEDLRKMVNEGDSTLTELGIQMNAIQKAIGELRDTTLREALKEMDSMQAWIQLMKETRGIWMKKGMNTDDLDAKIHLSEDTLGQYISELAAGRKMGSRFPDIIQSFRDAFRNRGH
ncbi:MAG: MG2 domain-containing protein, partial [Candidatus Bathyarchaeota archaeon]|nr:MG2 domain-containing protein [Candidatus Bathyarchaeota archaeon]